MLATPTIRADRAAPGYVPWGMLAAIDLHGCERERLEDPEHDPRASCRALIDAIGMRAHGPLMLERFGDGELEGWSAMQFIETSSITVHADEFGGRCFIDVFSCRPFDSERAAARRRRALRRHAHAEGAPPMTGSRPCSGARRRRRASWTRSRTSATSCAARRGRTAGRGSSGACSRSSCACPSAPTAPRGASSWPAPRPSSRALIFVLAIRTGRGRPEPRPTAS